MFHRSKTKTALVERDAVAEIAGKTAVVAGQAAHHAAQAAREARRAAAPVVRKGAVTAAGALSEAAEHAAEVFASTADRLATSEAGTAARDRIADKAEALAAAVRPAKKRRHRIRKLFLVSAVVGGVVAVLRSPFKTKLANKLFGEPLEDDEVEAITLPVDDAEGHAEVIHHHHHGGNGPRAKRHAEADEHEHEHESHREPSEN